MLFLTLLLQNGLAQRLWICLTISQALLRESENACSFFFPFFVSSNFDRPAPDVPLAEPSEAERVAALFSSVVRLEQGLEEQAANLGAVSRGERLPHPGTSHELLQEEANRLQQTLERESRARSWSVNAWYQLHDAVALRLLVAVRRLDVFRVERNMLMLKAVSPGDEFVAAVLVRQPRSQPIKRTVKRPGKVAKKVKSVFTFVVRLVGGAVTSFTPDLDSVTVSLVQLEMARTAKGQKSIALTVEVLSSVWDPEVPGFVVSVLFPDGTYVIPSALNVTVSGLATLPLVSPVDGSPIRVASRASVCNALPLVVCTNENQWEQAEGRLLRRQVFGGDVPDGENPTVPWILLSNWLSEFFLRATRQDLLDSTLLSLEFLQALPEPARCLSSRDLAYLHRVKFSNKTKVSYADFLAFWDWYGPACHQLRHNPTVRALYMQGLIFGLADKQDCLQLLEGRDPGFFLVYLHETSKMGDLGVAFVHNDGQTSRVLFHKIDQKKLRSPYGSLADFVRNKDELKYVVKPFELRANGTKINQLVAVEKHAAFRDFYSPVIGH